MGWSAAISAGDIFCLIISDLSPVLCGRSSTHTGGYTSTCEPHWPDRLHIKWLRDKSPGTCLQHTHLSPPLLAARHLRHARPSPDKQWRQPILTHTSRDHIPALYFDSSNTSTHLIYFPYSLVHTRLIHTYTTNRIANPRCPAPSPSPFPHCPRFYAVVGGTTDSLQLQGREGRRDGRNSRRATSQVTVHAQVMVRVHQAMFSHDINHMYRNTKSPPSPRFRTASSRRTSS